MAIESDLNWTEAVGPSLLSFVEKTQQIAMDVLYVDKFKGPIRVRTSHALILLRKRFRSISGGDSHLSVMNRFGFELQLFSD